MQAADACNHFEHSISGRALAQALAAHPPSHHPPPAELGELHGGAQPSQSLEVRAVTVIRRLDLAEIEVVRPLWEALLEHHGQLKPQVRPTRSLADSWPRLRAEYAQWLEAA